RHAALRADGARRKIVASRLDALRHGARRLPAEADERGAARRRLRLVLPAPLLPRLDLAPPAERPLRRPPLPRDVLSLQAQQWAVVLADPAAPRPRGLVAARRVDAAAPLEVPRAARRDAGTVRPEPSGSRGRARLVGRLGGRVT